MKGDIPDKLYFKIGEVSKLAEVAPHVIRYWETEFVAISPKRANSNQRLYRRQDVELILKIKTLLHGQGYTIAGARRFLQSGEELVEEPQIVKVSGEADKLGKIKSELLQLYEILEQKK
jgi:DNA-binding transcriptional MerR regulator